MNTDLGLCTKNRVERLTWQEYNLYLHTGPMQGFSVTLKHPVNMNLTILRPNKKINH